MTRSRGWVTLGILAPFIGFELLSSPLVREDLPLDFVLDGLAWLLFITGGAFRWSATLYVGGNKNGCLATAGPYSVCRNPLYLGNLFLALSIAVFLHSPILILGIFVATCFYLSVTISYEEKNLQRIFGDQYEQYCLRVPRLIPQFHLYFSPARIEVNTSGLAAEALRTIRWIWIPLISEIVSHLRVDDWR